MARVHRLPTGLSLVLPLLISTACPSAPSTSDSNENEEESAADSTTAAPVEDIPYSGGECLLSVAEDCADPDLKCMPWGEGTSPPTETRCCSLDPSPVSPGERCSTQNYVNSCLDDCPAESLCRVDDVDSLTGYCQNFCDIEDPDSCGSESLCLARFAMAAGAVTVPVCLSRCDPLLAGDCTSKGFPDWNCLPNAPTAPEFFCDAPTGLAPILEYGECLAPSDCAAGLSCLQGSQVLGCEDLERCCTRYCDVDQDDCAEGNACSGLESTVPGLENVGLCANPA